MAVGRHTMGVLLFKVVVYRLEELAVIARLHILGERHDPTAHHTQVLSVVDGQRIPIGQGLALHYSLILLLLVCRNTILIQTQVIIQMCSGRVYLLIAEICISFAPVLIDGVCSANVGKDMPQPLLAKFLIMCHVTTSFKNLQPL